MCVEKNPLSLESNTVGGDMQRILRNTGLKNVSALRNVRAPAKFTRNFRHSARALSVVAKPENASENRTKAMAAAAAAAGLLGLQLGFNQVDNCGTSFPLTECYNSATQP